MVDEAAVLDGAHGHGYLLDAWPAARGAAGPAAGGPADRWTGTQGRPALPEAVRGWRALPDMLPGARLMVHPRTCVSHHRGAAVSVLLLGHPVDVAAGLTDGGLIAERLARTWERAGDDALVREAARLGGRWTLVASSQGASTGTARMLVVPDTHATQPVFWSTRGGRLTLASAPSLVADAVGLEQDEDALRLVAELDARREHAVTYLPGRRTPYRDLDPLLPNCLLRVELDPLQVRHERFWPWQEREETSDVSRVWSGFRERLTEHVRLLTTFGRPGVSLTAGADSRVTAAFARPWVAERGGFTFTYLNPRDARTDRHAMADVTGASAVAQQLGLPHRLIRWRQPPRGGTFDVLHRRTYAPRVPSRGAAHAMWADLPRDLVQLQSNCAETGTYFVRGRTPEAITPLRLARIMMNADAGGSRAAASAVGLEDLAERMYGGYQDFADLHPDRLLGYDHHDLFYWEQRMGRWGHQKFQDADLGHRVLLPFNDRVLLELMLSLPDRQREERVLFDRVWAGERRARVPSRGGSPTMIALRGTSRLPERLERPARRALTGLHRRRTTSTLAFPDGYALLLPGRARTQVPPSWPRVALPVADRAVLRRHPGLTHALAQDSRGRWVLVLGRPADLEHRRVGAHTLAADLLPVLTADPDPDVGLARVTVAATSLVGRYLVVAGTDRRWVAVPDPLASLGTVLLDEGTSGLLSHRELAPGRTTDLPAGQGLRRLDDGSLDRLDLAPSGSADPERRRLGEERRLERLGLHVRLVGGRVAPWLALTPGGGAADLLPVLADLGRNGGGPAAVSWWDRLSGDTAPGGGRGVDPPAGHGTRDDQHPTADPPAWRDPRATQLFTDARAAWEAGVQHRVVGLREDVDGSSRSSEPGRTARALAAGALARTWGAEAEGVLPWSVALHEAVPAGVGLVLGAPPKEAGLAGRPWELVQGTRRVILPFSDRAL